jgi:hypothetical protein
MWKSGSGLADYISSASDGADNNDLFDNGNILFTARDAAAAEAAMNVTSDSPADTDDIDFDTSLMYYGASQYNSTLGAGWWSSANDVWPSTALTWRTDAGPLVLGVRGNMGSDSSTTETLFNGTYSTANGRLGSWLASFSNDGALLQDPSWCSIWFTIAVSYPLPSGVSEVTSVLDRRLYYSDADDRAAFVVATGSNFYVGIAGLSKPLGANISESELQAFVTAYVTDVPLSIADPPSPPPPAPPSPPPPSPPSPPPPSPPSPPPSPSPPPPPSPAPPLPAPPLPAPPLPAPPLPAPPLPAPPLPAPPLPAPPRASPAATLIPTKTVSAAISVVGYTMATFNATAKASFTRGFASVLNVSAADVTITSVTAYVRANSGRRHLLQSEDGVTVAFSIAAADAAAATVLSAAVTTALTGAVNQAVLMSALLAEGLAGATALELTAPPVVATTVTVTSDATPASLVSALYLFAALIATTLAMML